MSPVAGGAGIPIPDDEGDKRLQVEAEAESYLAIRRFYVAVTAVHPDGSEQIASLSPHYATFARAASELEQLKGLYRFVGVTSIVLLFDPTEKEDIDRYRAFQAEAQSERASWSQ